jgi:RNA polymerase sigma factor (sigma-70 family)
MSQTHLHLIDRGGNVLQEDIRSALEAAYRWAKREFWTLDPALIADWTEEIGGSMATKGDSIRSPRRYAFAALHGKIREWYRKTGGREFVAGGSPELEDWLGAGQGPQVALDRGILFEQIRSKLSERDRHILILLQQDIRSPADVAEALDISYSAAAKAIQRVKERISAILANTPLYKVSESSS